MKHIRKTGTVLFLAALAASQSFSVASAETSIVDVVKLFHSQQAAEEPVKQKKLDDSRVEEVRAMPIARARLHWDAVEKPEKISHQEKNPQEKWVELPPVQPVQKASEERNGAASKPQVVELPPIQPIPKPAAASLAKKDSEQVVELKIQPVP